MSKCDIAVAIAVKSLKEEYNLKFEKQEETINELKKQVNLLINNK
ncbi:hypothetical protein [Spiroplasma endosymbiont of Othius punctulatus]